MINCNTRFSNFSWNFKNQFIFISLLTILFCAGNDVTAQTYEEAKDLAYNGEREKARQICRKILANDFNSDVAVLMARLYAWDGKYDSTRVFTSQVLARDPEHRDAMDCLSDAQYWEEKYPEALKSCDIMLAKDPKDEAFMLKRANILNAMKQYDQSVGQLEDLLKIYPSNSEAMKKLEEIRLDQLKNMVRLSYTLDLFEKDSNIDPWHLVAFSYQRKTPIGLILARVNWAERYGINGFQYEMDAYPKFNQNNYAYLNVGFSDLSIFPKFRSGAEWYHIFPKSFEASLGMRLLVYPTYNTYVYTGSLGKYFGKYWISARTYVTPYSTGTSASAFLQARRYFADPENYFGLRLGYGNSPDDRSYSTGSDTYLALKSQSARVEYNHIYSRKWTTNVAFALINQEFYNRGYVMNYSFEFILGRFF